MRNVSQVIEQTGIRRDSQTAGRKKVRYWWVNQNQTFRQELDGEDHTLVEYEP